ncbi:hypothetical protein AURDEDRAFT_177042 [Auricularia subglabra TFB-10046 SS5]|uniref:F-box domain-containing protein n=1 Tax=Auricularia subglabra (strain TFB-10046 / SS5) TaxID=717982 RepID=J0WND7_AURST|nr:hypothetical protein AURDEDRAFT_177042 [Auricularia subglabra TFB-10046 SS5]
MDGAIPVPADILLEISLLLSATDRIAASGVCREWRRVCLAFPQLLWSRVSWRGQRSDSLAFLLHRALLARTLHLTVTLHSGLLLNRGEFFAVIAVIRRHIWHIVTLNVHIMDAGHTSAAGMWFIDRLWTPAPLLEEFSLMFDVAGGELRPPGYLFDRNAPRLQRLDFNASVFLPHGLPAALAAVTHLQSTACLHSLFEVLPVLPRLQHAHITSGSLEGDDAAKLFPGHLASLTIIFPEYAQGALSLLRFFSCAHIRFLRISFYFGLLQDLDACGLPGGTIIRHLSISSPFAHKRMLMRCTGDESAVVELERVPCSEQWPETLFAHVSEVIINDDVYWVLPMTLSTCSAITVCVSAPPVAGDEENAHRIFDRPRLDLPPMLASLVQEQGEIV